MPRGIAPAMKLRVAGGCWDPSLLCAQAIEQLRRCETVRDEAGAQLKLPDRRAGLGPQPAVRLADVEAVEREALLQLVALAEIEHALVARPGLRQRPLAAQAIGQV